MNQKKKDEKNRINQKSKVNGCMIVENDIVGVEKEYKEKNYNGGRKVGSRSPHGNVRHLSKSNDKKVSIMRKSSEYNNNYQYDVTESLAGNNLDTSSLLNTVGYVSSSNADYDEYDDDRTELDESLNNDISVGDMKGRNINYVERHEEGKGHTRRLLKKFFRFTRHEKSKREDDDSLKNVQSYRNALKRRETEKELDEEDDDDAGDVLSNWDQISYSSILDNVPYECLISIFLFLPLQDKRVSIFQVCSKWHRLVSENPHYSQQLFSKCTLTHKRASNLYISNYFLLTPPPIHGEKDDQEEDENNAILKIPQAILNKKILNEKINKLKKLKGKGKEPLSGNTREISIQVQQENEESFDETMLDSGSFSNSFAAYQNDTSSFVTMTSPYEDFDTISVGALSRKPRIRRRKRPLKSTFVRNLCVETAEIDNTSFPITLQKRFLEQNRKSLSAANFAASFLLVKNTINAFQNQQSTPTISDNMRENSEFSSHLHNINTTNSISKSSHIEGTLLERHNTTVSTQPSTNLENKTGLSYNNNIENTVSSAPVLLKVDNRVNEKQQLQKLFMSPFSLDHVVLDRLFQRLARNPYFKNLIIRFRDYKMFIDNSSLYTKYRKIVGSATQVPFILTEEDEEENSTNSITTPASSHIPYKDILSKSKQASLISADLSILNTVIPYNNPSRCCLITQSITNHLSSSKLRSLTLLDVNLTDYDMAIMSSCGILHKLKKLDLFGCHLLRDVSLLALVYRLPTTKDLSALEKLKSVDEQHKWLSNKCEQSDCFRKDGCYLNVNLDLEELKLGAFGITITDAGISHLKRLKNLKKLDISRCDLVTNKGMQYLKSLDKLEHLETNFCIRITEKCFKETLMNFGKSLKFLSMRRCSFRKRADSSPRSVTVQNGNNSTQQQDNLEDSSEPLEYIKHLSKLEHLDITETGGASIILDNMKHMKNLNTLIISRSDTSEVDLTRSLTEENNLEHLNILQVYGITDECVRDVISPNCTHLKTFKLSIPKVTDNSIVYGICKYMTCLKELHLDHASNLTNRSIIAIVNQLTKLESFSIRHNHLISSETLVWAAKVLKSRNLKEISFKDCNHKVEILENLK